MAASLPLRVLLQTFKNQVETAMTTSSIDASGDDLHSLARQEAATKHLMAARMKQRRGERAGAYEEVKLAFAAHPGDRAAIEMLGDLYLEDGETERALTLFERGLKAYPGHAPFEERLAMCRLDMAEMEADRIAKDTLTPLALAEGASDKIFERTPQKAVSLSLFLPGAGQFYNDEVEKGSAFLAAGLISFIAWFYPFWSALAALPKAQRLDFGAAIASLRGGSSTLFWGALLIWIGVYAFSMVDAGRTAAEFNANRRRALGLE